MGREAMKRRVSDQSLAIWENPNGIAEIKRDDAIGDLIDALKYIDELRERVRELGGKLDTTDRLGHAACDEIDRWRNKLNALRDAVKDANKESGGSDDVVLIDEADWKKILELTKSGGGESRAGESTSLADRNEPTRKGDRPAAQQILVRDGEPYRRWEPDNDPSIRYSFGEFKGVSLTKDHPLWPVYSAELDRDTVLRSSGKLTLRDGLYTVIDCEACGGHGWIPVYGGTDKCLTCGGTGQTLKRDVNDHTAASHLT